MIDLSGRGGNKKIGFSAIAEIKSRKYPDRLASEVGDFKSYLYLGLTAFNLLFGLV
jgi:hypothetical protein